MKQILLTIFCSYVSLLSSQGLIYIKDSSDKRERITLSRSTLATEVDYSAYTPLNYQQVGGTCVAHSFAKARAILLNKRLYETDNAKKIAHDFSPYFIYFNLTSPYDKGCKQGLNIETAARFVLIYGNAPLAFVEYPDYYPFTQYRLGFPYPNRYPVSLQEDAQVASKFRFSDIYRLDNAYDVKHALNDGMAVVVGMNLTEEFVNLTGSSYSYKSYHQPVNIGHAMVVVGYSDYILGGAFKIANSWGAQWGDNGFVWIDYNSFAQMLLVAYGCTDVSEASYGSALSNTPVKSSVKYGYFDSSFQLPLTDTSSAIGDNKLSAKDLKALKKNVKASKKHMADVLRKSKD
jgi:C1A family cysteine protease